MQRFSSFQPLPGAPKYSKGGFTIDWTGSKGTAEAIIETGRPGFKGLTFAITNDANIPPIAPHAMVISFCAPRLELELGLLGAYGGSTFLKVGAAAIDLAVDARSPIARELRTRRS